MMKGRSMIDVKDLARPLRVYAHPKFSTQPLYFSCAKIHAVLHKMSTTGLHMKKSDRYHIGQFTKWRGFARRVAGSFLQTGKLDPMWTLEDLEQEAFFVWHRLVMRYTNAAVREYRPLYCMRNGVRAVRRAIIFKAFRVAWPRELMSLQRRHVRRSAILCIFPVCPQVLSPADGTSSTRMSRAAAGEDRRGFVNSSFHHLTEPIYDAISQDSIRDVALAPRGYMPNDFLRWSAAQHASPAARGLLNKIQQGNVTAKFRFFRDGSRETNNQRLARLCDTAYVPDATSLRQEIEIFLS